MSIQEIQTYFGFQPNQIEGLKKKAQTSFIMRHLSSDNHRELLRELYENPVKMSIVNNLYKSPINQEFGDEKIKRITRTPLKLMGKDANYLSEVIEEMVSDGAITLKQTCGKPDYYITQKSELCMHALADARPLLDSFKRVIREDLKLQGKTKISKEDVNKISKTMLFYIMT